MAFVVGEDTYISVTDADSYFALRLYADAWTAATTAQKQSALAMATRIVDRMADWYGVPSAAGQKLSFPRMGVYNRNGDPIPANEIPQDIRFATCEQALSYLQQDTTRKPSSMAKGIASASVGSLSVSYVSASEFKMDKVCPATYEILFASCLGDVYDNGNANIRNVGIYR